MARLNPAIARFLLRLAQAKRIDERYDRETLPLFPLVLILEADETLSADARHLLQEIDCSAPGRPASAPPSRDRGLGGIPGPAGEIAPYEAQAPTLHKVGQMPQIQDFRSHR